MSTVRVVVVVCLVGLLAASAFAATQKVDYPLSVNTVQIDAARRADVVVVHYKNSTGADVSAELNSFMEDVVPAALRATGSLPAPASVQTMMQYVEIPNAKNCVIFNQDNLPIWLRVRADQNQYTKINEDRHERFDGVLMDPWTIESYFISQFTAVCRVNKYHSKKTFPYMKPAVGKHTVFNWVDP